MKCIEIQNMIMTDYIDGQLNSEMLKNVEEHLLICPECRDIKNCLEAVRVPLQNAQSTPSPEIWSRIQEKIASDQTRRHGILEDVNEFLRVFLFSPRTIFVKAAVIVVLVSAIILGPQWLKTKAPVTNGDIGMTFVSDEALDDNYEFGTALESYLL